jgi:hypothetical protein
VSRDNGQWTLSVDPKQLGKDPAAQYSENVLCLPDCWERNEQNKDVVRKKEVRLKETEQR